MGIGQGLRFDANLSILFPELPLLERPAAAAASGFDAVELWWPFASPDPPDAELDRLAGALADAGVDLVGLNFDAGDMPAGDRGLVSVPAAAARFRANVDVAVGLAGRLGCRTLNALYGNRVDGVDPAEQDELAVAHLALAASAAGRVGATVVVESQNPFDSPRYPLLRTAEVLAVLDRVEREAGARLEFLCDLYHLQRTEGNLIHTVERHWRRFGHVQVADSPGRNQPGTGEIAYERVLAALAATGYRGYVGLEYRPLGPTAESFAWLDPAERASRRRDGAEAAGP